jgi:hypothetical protein
MNERDAGDIVNGGAVAALQLDPPTEVFNSPKQRPVEHGSSPSAQPICEEMKDADWSVNMEIEGGIEVEVGPDSEVGAELVVRGIEDEAILAAPPPQAASKRRGRTTRTATASRRRSTMVSRPMTSFG